MSRSAPTISFDKAYNVATAAAKTLGIERVPLDRALGRILAKDVLSDADSPPFDNSAMDGYACRKRDLGSPMLVVETIQAGRVPSLPVSAGECSRIMTGAMLPRGADTVVMFECAEEKVGLVRVTGRNDAHNIRWQGENGHVGDVVLHAGKLITPGVVALLASVGCDPVRVSIRPEVTVMATGDELVEPALRPGAGKIRNSNGRQLCAQLEAMGVIGRYEGIIPDDLDSLIVKIRQAKKKSDLVLMSGGVSEGDYDLVPEAFRRCGYKLLFESVAMQPGRPTVFGRDGKSFCCGLPGNPVSTFVVFEILLKPFLHAMMGLKDLSRTVKVEMAGTYTRRKADRQSTIPMKFVEGGKAEAVEYHGSAHLLALSQADALLTIPAGVTKIRRGTVVHVRPV